SNAEVVVHAASRDRYTNRKRSGDLRRYEGGERHTTGDGVVPAFCLRRTAVVTVSRKEADSVSDSPAAESSIDHGPSIATWGQHPRGQRSVNEVEIGFTGQLFVPKRQLEMTGLNVDRFRQTRPRVDISPGRFLTEADRGLEILAELS